VKRITFRRTNFFVAARAANFGHLCLAQNRELDAPSGVPRPSNCAHDSR
jgi:hypothetical protein